MPIEFAMNKAQMLESIKKGWEGLGYCTDTYFRMSKPKDEDFRVTACCAVGSLILEHRRQIGLPVDLKVHPMLLRYGSTFPDVPANVLSMTHRINDSVWLELPGETDVEVFKKRVLERLEKELPEW